MKESLVLKTQVEYKGLATAVVIFFSAYFTLPVMNPIPPTGLQVYNEASVNSSSSTLGIKKSEPFSQFRHCLLQFGSGSWARTSDLIVNSDPLYH